MIKDNLKQIKDLILSKKNHLGLSYNIDLMAVSKTFSFEDIIEAIDAGQILFGENRVLEAYDKFKIISQKNNNFDLHIIGHLQRNKVKEAVEIANCIQSIDKIDTLNVLERICSEKNKTINFLIEVNTSNEPQKSGISPNDFSIFLENILKMNYKYCNLTGLMTVGPLTSDINEIRKSFKLLKNIFDKTKNEINKKDFQTISMGMSGDFEIAIEEGSNMLRIGSAIFGKR
jgi:PLP dependent protein